MPTATPKPSSVIFQAGKLGHLSHILEEIDWARELAQGGYAIDRVYGVSGGGLAALGFGLQQSAGLAPREFGGAAEALAGLAAFLTAHPAEKSAHSMSTPCTAPTTCARCAARLSAGWRPASGAATWR